MTEKIKRYSKRGEQTYFSGAWVKYEDHAQKIDLLVHAAIERDGGKHQRDCKFLRTMSSRLVNGPTDTRELERIHCNCGHYQLGQAIRAVT